MLSEFFKSVYFNAILAALAAFFAILQEVMIGTALPFINIFLLGAAVGVCFSWAAEALKMVFIEGSPYSWKNVLYGGGVGISAALVFALLML